MRLFLVTVLVASAIIGGLSLTAQARAAAPQLVPAPKIEAPLQHGTQKIVLAGGCFWGVEAVFEHVNGVVNVTSGYAGGQAVEASYDQVSMGYTAHAEAVEITYDADKITLAELLRIYFSVAHDPTQLNRQGPDVGSHYRSEIFAADKAVAGFAQRYIAELDAAKVYAVPIVTRMSQLDAFYAAEDYHQDFAARNPTHGYIVAHDAPKVKALQAYFPELYRAQNVR